VSADVNRQAAAGAALPYPSSGCQFVVFHLNDPVEFGRPGVSRFGLAAAPCHTNFADRACHTY
jgi:hypothetical protein